MKTTIVAGTGNAADMLDEVSLALGETVPATAGVFLTGDGGVVLFDASLTWRISDAAAYYLAADHVAPALRRLFVASAVGIAASRNIDDMIAVRPEHAEGDAAAQAQRETLRADLAAAMNRRLAALAADGAGLGVEIARVDLATLLLPQAKEAFDNVLNAAQTAEQGLANARTDAARTRQGAERDANRTLAEAHALAAEHIAEATGKTAEIVALAQNTLPEARASMLDQVYRERIGKVLRQAGATSAVDTRGVGRLILP
jgi:regulator of protease activity HflC (stomatin/prohibitin superfamily)